MLSYALAIAVAISSLILFSTAFFMSKIHRKDDFLWSAVGLFYALILWFCARNITGTVLLGQAAATVLITSYCWQTIKLRKVIANPALPAETNNFSVVRNFNRLFKRKPKPAAPIAKTPMPKVTEQEISIPETPGATPTSTPEMPATPAVREPAESNRTTSDLRSTQVIEARPNKVDDSEQVASQPLPNKLPETVAKTQLPADNIQPEKPTVQPIEQVDNLVTEAAKAVNPNSQIETNIVQEKIDSIPQPTVEPAPEVIAPKTEKSESNFDSLEIVEVAEVLDAEIGNDLNQRESENDNIIEVTTTDVNIVTETKKTDRKKIDDSDLS